MLLFNCKSAGEVWLNSLFQVMVNGTEINDHAADLKKNESVKLREFRNLYFDIVSVENDDEVIRKYEYLLQEYKSTPIIDYLMWYYSPETKHGYGKDIYNYDGINQYEWLVERLRNNPETKSATISMDRPGALHPPCISLIDFKYRNGLLDITAVYRSQNVFWKQPGNLFALRSLQTKLAAELGFGIGNMGMLVISAHIYERNYEESTIILKDRGLVL